MKIVEPSVTLLWVTPDSQKQIELAGRTCYKSEDKITPDSSAEFCKRMVKSGHHAMLEHACASFKIVTDRGISHEIVRHRLASYAQESTRYCDYSGGKFNSECSFIEPPGLDAPAQRRWVSLCREAEYTYMSLLAEKVSAQIARAVLPNCLKTEIVMTCNFREWRHFIQLRASKAAHPQIRPIAREIWEHLHICAPEVFNIVLS